MFCVVFSWVYFVDAKILFSSNNCSVVLLSMQGQSIKLRSLCTGKNVFLHFAGIEFRRQTYGAADSLNSGNSNESSLEERKWKTSLYIKVWLLKRLIIFWFQPVTVLLAFRIQETYDQVNWFVWGFFGWFKLTIINIRITSQLFPYSSILSKLWEQLEAKREIV